MDYLLAVSVGEPRTDLGGDLESFGTGDGSGALEPLREGLTFDEFHRDTVDRPAGSGECMQVVNLADIVVADLECGTSFRREALPVRGPGCFERDTSIQFQIDGLVDDAHASLANSANDAESIAEYGAGRPGNGLGSGGGETSLDHGRALEERIGGSVLLEEGI